MFPATEQQIHEACVQWYERIALLRWRDLDVGDLYHVPNGERRDARTGRKAEV